MSDESIFAAALELPDDAARAAFLDTACQGDAELRREMESLLAAHSGANPLDQPVLSAPLITPTWTGENKHPLARAIPSVIDGRYRVLSLLGEGGMGTVYRAEQFEPVRRRVAIKLIRLGMDSDRVLERFRAERQALAVMDHPGIAKVYDAGTLSSGQPYFAMELVEGAPLLEYCDACRLPIPERLRLFTQICRAVQHAHQKGILHRDLKPSNVLVAEVDGAPVAKVIDFGLAKALASDVLPDMSLDGPGVKGTPRYMSPEQADPMCTDIDTRTDVYSLGAILYELLTGSTPLEMSTTSRMPYDRMLQAIRETEPPSPSQRLAAGSDLASHAAARSTEGSKLVRVVRGELDWIAMKCLEKDRDRRYASAGDLIEDVRRYLAEEPVVAGPPSRWYARKKFLRRNRRFVLASVMVVAALAVGLAFATIGLFEARAQKEIADGEREKATNAAERAIAEALRANREAETADEVSRFLVGLFESGDPLAIAAANLQFRGRAGNATRAADLLARGVALLKSEDGLKRNPLVRARLLHEIASIQFSLGESAAARPLVEESLALRETHLSPDDPQTIKTLRLLAQVEYLEGEYADCVSRHREVMTRLGRSGDAKPLDLAETEISLSIVLSESDGAESLRLLRRGYDAYCQRLGENDFRTLTAGWLLAFMEFQKGNVAKAIPLATALLPRLEASEADPELKKAVRLPMQFVMTSVVAGEQEQIKQFREVVAQLDKVFGRNHGLTNRARRRLANMIYDAAPALPNPAPVGSRPVNIRAIFDDYKAGRAPAVPGRAIHPLHEAAILYAENVTVGPRWERTINRLNLGRTLRRCRLSSEGDAVLAESLAELRKLPPEVRRNHYPHNLALVAWRLAKDGMPDEADSLLREAATFSRDHHQYVEIGRRIATLMDLGQHCLSRNGAVEAAALFAEAAPMIEREDGANSLKALWVRAFEFAALRAAGRAEATEAKRQELEARFEKLADRGTAEARAIRALLDGRTVPWP